MAAVCKDIILELLQCDKVLFLNGCSVYRYYLRMGALCKGTICEWLQCFSILLVNGCAQTANNF